MNNYKRGSESVCAMCKERIYYDGQYWVHFDGVPARIMHQALPTTQPIEQHDRLIIQQKRALWLTGETTWIDCDTPTDDKERQDKLRSLREVHGVANVRLVRYVTTMEVVEL
jgi:hypothetical protein